MFELISETSVIPRSLYITDVRTDMDLHAIDGSYGHVFNGQYDGKAVALKVIEKVYKDVSTFFSLFHPKILIVWGEDQSGMASGSFSMAIVLTPIYSPSTGHI